MRVTMILAAAMLAAAGPAAAQNTTVADTDNSISVPDPAAPIDDNAAMAGNLMVDNSATIDAMPIEEEAAPAPAPTPKKSFPWGLLGLIGLVGLIGRKR